MNQLFGRLATTVFGYAYVITGPLEVVGVILPSMFLLVGIVESCSRERQSSTIALRAIAITAGIVSVIWYFG